MERTKDPLVNFKSPKIKEGKGGHPAFSLSLDVEEALEFAAIITEKATKEESTGVRFDIYFSEGTNSHTGSKFLKAFSYIKSKGQGPINRMGSQAVPKKVVSSFNQDHYKEKIAAAKKKLSSKQVE